MTLSAGRVRPYVSAMLKSNRWWCVFAATGAVALALLAPSVTAHAGVLDDNYSIMKPEPWLGPRYKSPRGTVQSVTPPRTVNTAPRLRSTEPPPPLVVPGAARALPNLPVPRQGYVPGGRAETFSDRATRCSHQAGIYGAQAGDPGTYIRSCINQ